MKSETIPEIKNDGTKAQIREFLENAIKKAKNPDPSVKIKRIRKEKAQKIAKNYGF